MIQFRFPPAAPNYLLMTADRGDEKAMRDLEYRLNKVPDFCYLPQYKGIPYKEEFLFKRAGGSGQTVWYCARGLCQEICDFFKANNVPYAGIDRSAFKRDAPPFEEFVETVRGWGLKYEPRPYQYEAAWKVLGWKQSLSEVATRAGKTLIAYIVFRYLMENQGVGNILMIVPSVQLVKQGYEDFKEYAEFFKAECVWAGGSSVESSNLTIGTFQSLIKKLDKKSPKYDPGWFDKFGAVFVDEVHRATAAQVKEIISQPFFAKCSLVYGMTGTLPKENTIERFTLAALLGTKIQDITAKELMDGGFISNVEIHQIKLKHEDSEALTDLYIKAGEYLLGDAGKTKIPLQEPKFLYKHAKTLPPGVAIAKTRLPNKTAYRDYLISLIQKSDATNALLLERMVIHELKSRVELLKELVGERPGNWLVLTHHKEYTKHVYEELKSAFPDRKLFKIDSAVSVKKRTEIVEEMRFGNSILVASYGCMSTGMTLPDLRYGALFESFKSSVVNIQSIGRGLGKTQGKDKYELWDFVDILPTKKIEGQGRERAKIYKKQSYPFDQTAVIREVL